MKRLFALAAAMMASATPGLAQDLPKFGTGDGRADHIVVACPKPGQGQPMFRDTRSGYLFPIIDPLLRAVATKACDAESALTTTPPASNVSVTNSRATALYVSFTLQSGAPGPIQWTTNASCVASGVGIQIAAGQTCAAYIPPAANSSRFCAALDAAPANCWLAQVNHQTMVETTFLPASDGGCFGQGACVWYDISVIPLNCTDKAWASDKCTGTGGASYNLPVQLTCGTNPTYTCQGPPGSTWGSENYPSNCGTPEPKPVCIGNTANCVNAYFFPMFSGPPAKYQPNQACLGGNVLGVNFLSGS